MRKTIKPCEIRNDCRWFNQEGSKACTICTFVITNNVEESDAPPVYF